ncbi:lactosylceramide 1,3-N-acetyl-beta-D-glucosaminyltransferase-like [Scleropages formosus]|uniref:Hexosyltransferase n=1 Tax=Scleropages formosus TaxID=113540 RepID=A0A0P7XHV6_SCLFO|nr:lactosylceramide 1,3-N-acetyl-beta-D-glucosaminyltransferase A-like [Scleropages formosus]KPP76003.1 lactosylceramide 1,3-N-acetyl-beta-D-glucosaminyltransferase-like [Scleropages formosus]
MFINARRIKRSIFFQLLTLCFICSILTVTWEELDHHVVSHVRAFSYRYLVNDYSFINRNFHVSREEDDNINKYPYLINPQHKCQNHKVLLLLFVKSLPEHTDRRNFIRSTWGNETYVRKELGVDVRVVFALGVHAHPLFRAHVQQKLIQEDHMFKDLVQQDFLDTFHNLTVKLMLQFSWAHTYCPYRQFFMSADDDMFIHVPNLVRYLRELNRKGVQNFWVGRVHRGSPPVRHKKSKYYVPYEVYPWVSYPDYTPGGGYLISGDVVRKIYKVCMMLSSTLYIDDVFMGISAKIIGVSPQNHIYFSGEGKAPSHPCIYDKMLTSHGHVTDMLDLWKEATKPQIRNISTGLMGNMYCTLVKAVLFCKPFSTYPCMAAFS